ncbi:MAG TPA: hypothetical protein VKE95_21340 [Burkholderiales bacterium]|nr:hypothetical protein [Burkholderiales bacterium]
MRTRIFHRALGATALAVGVAYGVEILRQWSEIRPFTGLGWHREHLATAGALAAAGALMLLTGRARSPLVRMASALFLTVVALGAYHRHFSYTGALFAALGALDGFFLAWAERPARRALAFGFAVLGAGHLALIALAVASRPPTLAQPAPPPGTRAVPDSDGFERFRRESYLASGVAPKRYFGFFDETGDTAAYETVLRRAVIDGVRLANEYAARKGLTVRITEQEVAITFLAEGGALMLTSMTDAVERVHPVYGIGLDNYREGLDDYPSLAASLDDALGSRLERLTLDLGGRRILLRPMTFREALAGTILMYLHQKARTDRLLVAAGRPALATMSLPAQFVTASLVYNSGILFAPERVDDILAFRTGPYLDEVNRLNAGKRPRLPLYPPAEAKARLDAGEPYPRQLTSWNAVYHVLQRYGAWVGVSRFATVFDANGAFRERR